MYSNCLTYQLLLENILNLAVQEKYNSTSYTSLIGNEMKKNADLHTE